MPHHVMKDKVITGMSGAEFGVRCWINAYNLSDGKRAWRAYSMGPDDEMLFGSARRPPRWVRQSVPIPH